VINDQKLAHCTLARFFGVRDSRLIEGEKIGPIFICSFVDLSVYLDVAEGPM
jgi:hypothetical protein